ncbi:type II toxin-antitoxin system Phd/YefM family antitoxin [Burkholderia guangdongensis]|uniref:type II toxin-antitoxin system Phd/YefM family antitoxin n=1 Tax=Burkholderia guangdongensis TaxID=1792500 RepID=UPI0015C7416D|nr:type II toxin-antitoxin system prevent-host-death family antitoxin [Burkholderia guangdongensis]
MPIITATDLARHTRQILDRVARSGETVIVERNQTPVARIVPAEPNMTASQALEGLATGLSAIEGQRWLQDSRADFSDEVRDPWA